uniref:Uncharacterized protein n=1 Tax=Arundo donax TaxID=35708 RepID=A0A0A9BK50_ARUDO
MNSKKKHHSPKNQFDVSNSSQTVSKLLQRNPENIPNIFIVIDIPNEISLKLCPNLIKCYIGSNILIHFYIVNNS